MIARQREIDMTSDFQMRVAVVALAAVFVMAGVAVFILGRDSALIAVLMTLATILSGLAGYEIRGKKEAG